MSQSCLSFLRFGVAALSLSGAFAHTWIEQLQQIDPKTGKYFGDYGYPRGFVARGTTGFDGFSNMNLLPPDASHRTRADDTDLLCHPAQRVANQTTGFPSLNANAGAWLALRYTENGHTTLTEQIPGKPKGSGTVYIFGTTDPKSDEKLLNVMNWSKDGKGGDGRGVLLAAQNYDDGRCWQVKDPGSDEQRRRQKANPNDGHELWCEADVQLPAKIDGQSYTLYWVWDWPTAPGTVGLPNGKDEWYTTCMDINIADTKVADVGAKPKNVLGQQDPMASAVTDFASRTAISVASAPASAAASSTGAVSSNAAAPSTSAKATSAQGGNFSPAASSAAPKAPDAGPDVSAIASSLKSAASASSGFVTSAKPSSQSVPLQSVTVTVTDVVTRTVTAGTDVASSAAAANAVASSATTTPAAGATAASSGKGRLAFSSAYPQSAPPTKRHVHGRGHSRRWTA